MAITKKQINTLFADYKRIKNDLHRGLFSTNTDKTYAEGKKDGMEYAIMFLGLKNDYKYWLYKQGYYKLSSNDIMQYCIKHNLYTFGTNTDYNNLLKSIDSHNITIKDIAKDIYDNSRYLDGKSPKDLETEIIDTVIRED